MAVELLRELRSLGVELSIDGGGRLAFDGPGEVIDDDLLARMRANRDGLMALIRARPTEALVGDPGPECIEPIPGVICPWCNGGDRLIDSDAGLDCDRCGRLAFRWLGDRSIERCGVGPS